MLMGLRQEREDRLAGPLAWIARPPHHPFQHHPDLMLGSLVPVVKTLQGRDDRCGMPSRTRRVASICILQGRRSLPTTTLIILATLMGDLTHI